MKAPCLNCKDRTIYCHSSCNKYKKFRSKLDKAKSTKEDIEFSDYLWRDKDEMQQTVFSRDDTF